MVDKIISPRRAEDWIDPNTGTFSLRAIKFFESISNISNETTEIINNSTEEITGALRASTISLNRRIGSGIPLTIDTTGFTVDTTKQFTDQTEV